MCLRQLKTNEDKWQNEEKPTREYQEGIDHVYGGLNVKKWEGEIKSRHIKVTQQKYCVLFGKVAYSIFIPQFIQSVPKAAYIFLKKKSN